MKKEYDFSNAERGRFFRGSKPLRIVAAISLVRQDSVVAPTVFF